MKLLFVASPLRMYGMLVL